MKQKKHYSFEEALAKLQKYCAYQERSHHDVRYKLVNLGVYGDVLEQVMTSLISDDFLNEERFARSFARGKFRMNNWGKGKIRMALKQKQVSDYCISKGMSEIEDQAYQEALISLLEKRLVQTTEKNKFTLRRKLADFCIRRGFETEIVWDLVNKMTP